VTAATAMEAAMKESDGDEGNGEGDSGGGQATVTRVEGKGQWRGRQELGDGKKRAVTTHFILNWNKMFDLL